MARYITSIGLADASKAESKKLLSAMGRASFAQIKPSGTVNRLDFSYQGGDSLIDVLHSVTRVVKGIGKNYPFTVIKDKPGR